jgi:hypothetical protein
MNPKIHKRSSVLLSNNYGSTVCKKAANFEYRLYEIGNPLTIGIGIECG